MSDELTALLVLERAGGVVHAGVGAGGPPRVTVQHASLHAAAGRTSGHPPTPRALGLPNVPMGGRHAPPHPSLPFVGGAHNHHPTDAPLVWCHMQRRGYAKGAAKKKQPKRKPSFGQALPTNTGLKNALEKYGPALMEALTPKQVAREDLSEEEKAEFEARAKEYSRKKARAVPCRAVPFNPPRQNVPRQNTRRRCGARARRRVGPRRARGTRRGKKNKGKKRTRARVARARPTRPPSLN